jgi:hypothetical protein
MATTGKAAWEKYYARRGDVETIIKKDSDTFDEKTPSKITGKLNAGQKITVPETKEYDSKPVVTYKLGAKTYRVRVKFDMLQKPGVKGRSAGTGDNVKTIGNKVLTPDGLGLSGKIIPKGNYLKEVQKAIQATTMVAPHVKEFLIDILKNSSKDRATLQKKEISEKDIAIIGKDFGEISGAWWFLNNYDKNDGIVAIEFPSKANEKLVDYYAILKNKMKIPVSAKSDEGAAPSISSVWAMIKGTSITDPSDRKVYNFIGAISEYSGTDGIIMAAKAMDSQVYQLVRKIIGEKGDYDNDSVEEWLKNFKDGQAAFDSLNEHLYSKIGRAGKLSTLIEMWNTAGQRKSGAILSPMAYAIVDEVNENPKYTGFLTDILRSHNIQQLYIYLSATSVEYDLRGFAESNFVFEYHSNAANPGGNKIGFKLKK